jgi:hypothetical protein
MPNDYKVARTARKDAALPPSKGESVKPDFLLHHENHFDPNTYTPEGMIQKGILKGPLDPEKQT